MGCLTAAIYTAFLYDIDSSVDNKNVEVLLSVNSQVDVPEVVVLYNTPIEVYADCLNRAPSTVIDYIAQSVEVAVSLVCAVAEGEYELLRVFEGNTITIDGGFIKVLRNGV